MSGCPMAYPYVCENCSYSSSCPPSKAVDKLNELQTQFNELKQMLEQLSRKIK